MERSEFELKLVKEMAVLTNHARHFTQDIEESQDLMQETIIKALRFCSSFKEGTNLKGWLYTIMRNAFIDSCNFKTRVRSEIMQVEDLSATHLLVGSINNSAESKMRMDEIRVAMSKLKNDLSEPFSMYYSGYRYHEICQMLSLPMGTVKTRIHLARKLLQKTLEPYRYRATA